MPTRRWKLRTGSRRGLQQDDPCLAIPPAFGQNPTSASAPQPSTSYDVSLQDDEHSIQPSQQQKLSGEQNHQDSHQFRPTEGMDVQIEGLEVDEGPTLHTHFRENSYTSNLDQVEAPIASSFLGGHGIAPECDDDQEHEDRVNEGELTPLNDEEIEMEAVAPHLTGHKPLPLRWTALTAVLVSIGSGRFTEEGYDTFRSFMHWNSKEDKLPSIETVRRNIRPSLRQNALIKTDTHQFPVDFSKSAARAGLGAFRSTSLAPVMIVKPSEWTKAYWQRTKSVKS